jgi:hypothetical protein
MDQETVMKFRLTLKNPEGREHSVTTEDIGVLRYELEALSEIPELLKPGGTYLIERIS